MSRGFNGRPISAAWDTELWEGRSESLFSSSLSTFVLSLLRLGLTCSFWPHTCWVAEDDLRLPDSPASFQALRLQVCATAPWCRGSDSGCHSWWKAFQLSYISQVSIDSDFWQKFLISIGRLNMFPTTHLFLKNSVCFMAFYSSPPPSLLHSYSLHPNKVQCQLHWFSVVSNRFFCINSLYRLSVQVLETWQAADWVVGTGSKLSKNGGKS